MSNFDGIFLSAILCLYKFSSKGNYVMYLWCQSVKNQFKCCTSSKTVNFAVIVKSNVSQGLLLYQECYKLSVSALGNFGRQSLISFEKQFGFDVFSLSKIGWLRSVSRFRFLILLIVIYLGESFHFDISFNQRRCLFLVSRLDFLPIHLYI